MPDKIHVKLSNRVALLKSEYDYDQLIPYWSFSVPGYQYAIRSKPWLRKCKFCKKYPNTKTITQRHDDKDHTYEPIWDGRVKIFKRDRLPAGLYHATKAEIQKQENIQFVEDRAKLRMPKMFSSKYWLRSEGKYYFQNDCVDKMQGATAEGGGLVLNATGSGKTRIAAMYASRFACNIIFVVDQLNLLEQARHDIAKHLGEKIGKVGESEFKLRRVTVATRQTLSLHINDPKFRAWYETVDVFFIDEIHEQINKANFGVIAEARPMAVFGLTATLGISKKPVRLKAFSLCGPILYEYPVKRGMADEVLSKGIAIQLLYNNSIKDTSVYESSNEAYVDEIVRNKNRNRVIERIIRRGNRKGKYTIVLVERLKHLSRISHGLGDVPHRIIAGTFRGKSIKKQDRIKHQKHFEKGKIRVILANKVMKKGVDIKRVDVGIDGAARQSREDAVQKFGRLVRLHDDKTGAIYIDICDTDKYDKDRAAYNKYHTKKKKLNWFAKAAKRRARGLKLAGITVKKFKWGVDGKERELFKQAEYWLKKEIKKHEQ